MKLFKDRINTFEKVTLHESWMRGVADFEIVCEGEKSTVTRYDIRFTDGEDVRIPDTVVTCRTETVLDVLNACDLLAWDGFHGKHPKGVLDGTIFRLEATVNEGETIHADGSQNFPKNYRVLKDWIYDRLRESK